MVGLVDYKICVVIVGGLFGGYEISVEKIMEES